MTTPSSSRHHMFGFMLLLFCSVFSCCCLATNNDALTSDSVIVITGAAGFLGSSLAMSLYRTYSPRKIICIDSMDAGLGLVKKKTDQDLALLEFKRQRVFHLMQTLGDTAYFYRVDLRPTIPEYFDTGEVPVLANIFRDHPDITHVVHFADQHHWGHVNQTLPESQQQVVPRVKNQPKAGLMESILEQVRLFQQEHGRQPHLLYASSSQVYPTSNVPNEQNMKKNKPMTEDMPLSTPSTLAGATKLLDEIMAQTYYDTLGILSVGLRFFNIYGPWGLPGSPVFEIAERMVAAAGNSNKDDNESILMEENVVNDGSSSSSSSSTLRRSSIDTLDEIRDYLYIDDAMDAVMAAMQFRATKPVVINVGSGQGVTLRDMALKMATHFPSINIHSSGAAPSTAEFASTTRAQEWLGFQPRVSLEQGLEKLLAWHYDRAFPYGAKPVDGFDENNDSSTAKSSTRSTIASKGIVSCNRYDKECLKGTPVFPCASECAHEQQCIPSFWDDVVHYTKALTAGCETVLYTVALDDKLTLLPSTVVKVSQKSKPFVQQQKGYCNVAFVSEDSALYTGLASAFGGWEKPVQHGSWSLVPVKLSDFSRSNWNILGSLPKLSPGQFFGLSCRHAIYADPDVIFHSIPKLLQEATMQPYNSRKIPGSTALLIGKRNAGDTKKAHAASPRWNTTRSQDQVQDHAYRMIRMAVIEEMAGDGFAQLVDSSFVVHELANEDSRLFRCDVYGEVVQWDASSDEPAFQFTMALHDMWSRIIANKMGLEPWWIGDDVLTVDHNGKFVHNTKDKTAEQVDSEKQQSAASDRRLQEGNGRIVESNGEIKRRLEETTDTLKDAAQDTEHTGFGLMDAAQALFGETKKQLPRKSSEHQQQESDDDFELVDDWTRAVDGADVLPVLPKPPKDPSSYDTWMGILSSTSVRSFSRIVTMEAVGAVHIEDYQELAYS